MSSPGTIVCFGELLLRLSAPNRELLLQSARLDVAVGGAEANVAVGLAALGHATRMVSTVPDTALGRAATDELARRRVDVATVATGPGRMGLYFLTPGAGLRPSDIVYDREHSAFVAACSAPRDWDRALDGAAWLHLSGITPALGADAANAARAAVAAARRLDVKISFDGNYRERLWGAWDSDPRAVLTDLVAEASLLFGNHRDISLLLGATFSGEGPERRREAAEAAFDRFPNLEFIASTARHADDADRHRLSGRIDTPVQGWQTPEIAVSGIVDRIGTGDAFASGVLHGLIEGHGPEAAVRSGLSLCALKHSLPGDASLFTRADLAAFDEGGMDVRR